MSLQTLIQVIAILAVTTVFVVIGVGAYRVGVAEPLELWRHLKRRPLLGPLLRIALPLAAASIVLDALLRVGRLMGWSL